MIFALDHDGTYDRAPELWNAFISLALAMGHQVICVTMRGESVPVNIPGCSTTYYTRGKAKAIWLEDRGIKVDVWIDDQPYKIVHDAGSRL